MIHLTRLNRVPLVINADLIEHIDVTPDTLIVLTNGQKIIVLETAEQVVERVVGYRRSLLAAPSLRPESAKAETLTAEPARPGIALGDVDFQRNTARGGAPAQASGA